MNGSRLWPWAIGTVLLTTVAANLVLYHVAGSDPSMVIEPDYYAKAVAWDSTMAQSRRNSALGWHVSPTLTAYSAHRGARLTVTVTDSTGQRIAGATVKVSAVYNARAGHVLEATLSPDGDAYSTTLDVEHGGQWVLEFDVTRNGARFTSTSRVEAISASAGP